MWLKPGKQHENEMYAARNIRFTYFYYFTLQWMTNCLNRSQNIEMCTQRVHSFSLLSVSIGSVGARIAKDTERERVRHGEKMGYFNIKGSKWISFYFPFTLKIVVMSDLLQCKMDSNICIATENVRQHEVFRLSAVAHT